MQRAILRKIIFVIALFSSISGFGQSVKLTEVEWHGAGCYKIEMTMGTVYFEKDSGVSGFKSFIDPDGNDWIASYMEPGPNGDFRGFPNSVGNFGHAGRNSGSKTVIVDNKKEGDVVVLESSNDKFTFQYWFFANHIAIKVLKSEGDYCFLLECVAGGTADAEDYFVLADGEKRTPKGEFYDFTPEWFYLGDPKSEYLLFLGKSPEDDAPNENHRQIRPNGQHNMDLYSFGRAGREHKYKIEGMSGNEHICIIGFAPVSRTHNEITTMIESLLDNPFSMMGKAKNNWSKEFLKNDNAWFASDDARSIANSVIQYQSSQGGWPKSTDLTRPPLTPGDVPPEGRGRANSIDNDATTLPMEFLARVIDATGDEKFIAPFNKGLDYLFSAQYPSGGWPQFWPLRGDQYYSRVTFNDGAMIRVMNLLNGVSSGKAPYSFVDKNRRASAADAVTRGIDFILRSQIKHNDVLTAWCAQHNENTYEPAWGRAYEPPSLSGQESVDVVKFLMEIDNPSPEVVNAIEGAINWLKAASIIGVRLEEKINIAGRKDNQLIPDPGAPPLWARFYELGTNRPVYPDRGSIICSNFNEVSHERQSGYDYHGYWAKSLIEHDYPLWRARHLAHIDEIPGSATVVEAEKGRFTGIIDRHSCWHNVMLSDAPHTTHSGRGAVDTKNEVGSYIEVYYNASWSGPHKITVRYTHIKSDPRPGELLVNNKKAAKFKLAQSEALPAWKTESVVVKLDEGRNVLRLSALKDGGLPNTDYIKVAEVRNEVHGLLPRVQILEAEDGLYTGKEDHHSCWNFIAQIDAAHSGFTGEGYVDTYNEKGSYIEVDFDSPVSGTYLMGVRYVHGKNDTRSAKISVNNVETNQSMAFVSTGTWTTWTTINTPVELKAGRNTIRLTALGSQGLVNIDHFVFTPVK
ncbi:MAG: pectate lyase [Bacteroidales bacterium]